jgi:two-component system, response regulator / RNA-binding antiterminator
MRVGEVSVLIIDENLARAAIIEDGLRAAGHRRVAVITDMKGVVRQIENLAPDVIVMDLGNPNRDFLEHMFRVSKASGKPVAMFVDRSDDAAMRAAIEAGVSAYVVDGLKKDRIKPILDLAILRFRAFEQLRAERDTALQALDDRKTLDRAKGIVMKLKGISEDEAYALLRQTAMSQGRRIADISQAVIASADLLKGGER